MADIAAMKAALREAERTLDKLPEAVTQLDSIQVLLDRDGRATLHFSAQASLTPDPWPEMPIPGADPK